MIFAILISIIVVLILIITVLAVDRKRKIDLINRLGDDVSGLKKVLAGKSGTDSLNTERNSNFLYNGLVEMKNVKSGNRSTSTYSTTEKMPVFGSIPELVSYVSDILYEDNPTIMKVAPFGSVVKFDDYSALKVIIQNIFNQLYSLSKK